MKVGSNMQGLQVSMSNGMGSTGTTGAAPGLEPRAAVHSVLDLFEANASAHPQRPLFLTKEQGRWEEVTYGEMKHRVECLRRSLSSLGVEVGDRIGIIADNCVEWAVIAYAAYGLGAAVVPMYTNQLARDWEYIIADAGLVVLFVANESIRAKVALLQSSTPSLRQVVVMCGFDYQEFLRLGEPLPSVRRRPSGDQMAAIMYTSGTTGQPKGVVLSHANILSNVLPLRDVVFANNNPAEHRTLSILPWAHAFGHTVELHVLIAAGASMAIAESIEKISDNMRQVRPTALVAVPRVFIGIYAAVQRLLKSKPRWVRALFRLGLAAAGRKARGAPLAFMQRLALAVADRLIFRAVRQRLGGRLEFAVSGAAALPAEVAEFITALGVELYEGYGLTETSPIVSANIPGQSKLGTVGRPLPGVRVEIDRAVSIDSHSGEIVVYGPNVMQGYHQRDHVENIFTKDGGFRTGDAGYLDEEGYLHITGRIKERYKLSNGKYVAPGPLESALKLSPFVSDAMVHGDGRPHNVALLVPERAALAEWAQDNGLGGLALDQLCAEPKVIALFRGEIERALVDLRGYERIGEFCVLHEEFSQDTETLTPSLKLKRHKIVERYTAEIEAMYQRTARAAEGVELAL
jgi:long-chain acyl-CoA synthetase